MPEPLALLSKLHPEHQDVWRASWENLFMEIPNTDGALRYYMASVFDTIAATYCPQKSVTHAGMRAIVDSIGCSPLVFLKGLHPIDSRNFRTASYRRKTIGRIVSIIGAMLFQSNAQGGPSRTLWGSFRCRGPLGCSRRVPVGMPREQG